MTCLLLILASPLLAFAYGIYRGGWEYALENLWILLIPNMLLLGYWCCVPSLYSGPPRPPGPALARHLEATLVALPLYGLLFHRASQFMFVRPSWICRCGYNLTGNVSGRCPECGEWSPPLTRS